MTSETAPPSVGVASPGSAATEARRPDRLSVHPVVERLAAYSWRLLAIAVVVVGILWLLERLRIVVLSVLAAVFLTRILAPAARWLERQGVRPALASAATLVGSVAVAAATMWFVAPQVADEFGDVPSMLGAGLDDIERWLVEDSPFEVTHDDIDRLRDEAGDVIGNWLRENQGSIVTGAITAVEILAGTVVALFMTFFFVKDGRQFRDAIAERLPGERRDAAYRAADGAWEALGGYLRGAAVLGIVEGVVIGGTLAAVGGSLALPVGMLTFFGAFVPYLGATLAGVVAVLVALSTASPTGAIVVAAVAVVVQQLDNEVLAPLVYGRATQLHPLVVLLSVAIGGALFGAVGSFLAVPLTAVAASAVREVRRNAADRVGP